MKSVLTRHITESMLVQSSVRSYFEPLVRLLVPHYRAGAIAAKVLKIKKQAGYVWLTLKPSSGFNGFLPGQHIDLSCEINGSRVQRTFSICSSLQEFQQNGTIDLAIKLVANGQLSRWLERSVLLGSWLYMSKAQGEFVLKQQKPLCLIAAGSGITPIRAMLLSISRMTQPITLIYSYRGDGVFNDDFRALAAEFPLFNFIAHDTENSPRLSVDSIMQHISDPAATDFYLCGPTPMIQQLKPALQQLGHRVSSESFGGVSSDALVQAVTFHRESAQQQVSGQGTLLQLAEQAGLNPRYGCRRGICQQCQCQKLQGQVKNLLTGELSGAGAEPIQLCISEAVTSVDIRL
ncbi:MAG: 2Fe-2S iron-sulfur cluster binding domain-containing protein [Gammaproteobacteria bacterium]|nr:2Fe-2S iron-sulfur cluster binding domain-containing protein [Gammaproteobacteria bacterium]